MRMFKKLFAKRERKVSPTCSVVIVAAGTASRMEGRDKILWELEGAPVIIHSLRPFVLSSLVEEIIIVTRQDILLEIAEQCKLYGLSKITKIVPGGATRTASVQIGLRETRPEASLVAIHDGARPLVTQELVEDVILHAAKASAAAPGCVPKDTIKSMADGVVTDTLPRESLRCIQTPQVFERSLIRAALAKAVQDEVPLTDDCAAVERLGFPVCITAGDEENIKLTTPLDLLVAEQILRRRGCL